MTAPRISICVPTFNRERLLRRMLKSLDIALRRVPNLSYEVVFADNASTDNTAGVIRDFSQEHPTVYKRNDENIGVTRNILTVPQWGSGQFAWLLGDDDLVVPGAIEAIVSRLDQYPECDGHIVCHSIVGEHMRGKAEWVLANAPSTCVGKPLIPSTESRERLDLFERVFEVSDVSGTLNFLSNVVFRRTPWQKCVGPYLRHCEAKEWFSDAITSAGYMCVWADFLAGRPVGLIAKPMVIGFVGQQQVLSRWPTIMVAFFLDVSQCFLEAGADRELVRRYQRGIYGSAALLAGLAGSEDEYTRQHFSVARLLLRYGDDPALWRSLFGATVAASAGPGRRRLVTGMLSVLRRRPRQVLLAMRGMLWSFQGWLKSRAAGLRRRLAPSYEHALSRADRKAARYFSAVVNGGDRATVRHPVYLRQPGRVRVGQNLWAGSGLRLEAWAEHGGLRYNPSIEIGNNVILNYNCHIGAINRIVIGDDALIGSNVLITDHNHGKLDALVPGSCFREQPLFSSGPVEIGRNVWIGENACILPGVRVGDNAVVAANAVVVRNVPPCAVVAGAPATTVRDLGGVSARATEA